MVPSIENIKKFNLVVVDDEHFICEIIREILSTESRYHVDYFCSPEKALEHIKSHPVDLVLTDFFMERFSGMDILEASLKHHPESIVIIMTGHPTIENVISVLKLGAFDYLVKPFKLESLQLAIERGLNAYKLARENKHLKSLVSLYQISEAMGSTIHLKPLLDLVIESIVKEFSTDLVSISLYDSYSECLVLEAFHGPEEEIKQNPLLSGKSEINYRVLKDAKPYVENKFDEKASPDSENFCHTYVSQVCHPLLAHGKVVGTLNLVRSNHFNPFDLADIHMLWILASKAATAIEHSRIYNELSDAYIGTVRAFANAVEARDNYTRGHTERVFRIAKMICKGLGWEGDQLKYLYMGCILHDIGKIGVPDVILNKPAKFTAEEEAIMRKHPEMGVKMLEGIPMLEPALPYILYHHESYDGNGYPLGLRGENIPIEGRILAIADTVDAILTNRPYRLGASMKKVVQELIDCSGTQFDPELVKLFLNLLEKNDAVFKELYQGVDNITGVLEKCNINV